MLKQLTSIQGLENVQCLYLDIRDKPQRVNSSRQAVLIGTSANLNYETVRDIVAEVNLEPLDYFTSFGPGSSQLEDLIDWAIVEVYGEMEGPFTISCSGLEEAMSDTVLLIGGSAKISLVMAIND